MSYTIYRTCRAWQACKKPVEPGHPPPQAVFSFLLMGGPIGIACLQGNAVDPATAPGTGEGGGLTGLSALVCLFCCPCQAASSSSSGPPPPPPPADIVQPDGAGWRAGAFYHDGQKWHGPGAEGDSMHVHMRKQQALG